jgi:hypothetical protein
MPTARSSAAQPPVYRRHLVPVNHHPSFPFLETFPKWFQRLNNLLYWTCGVNVSAADAVEASHGRWPRWAT